MEFNAFANQQMENESNEKNTETILLVEDEDFVRNVTSEVLEMEGYRVLQASNATEGLRMFERHAGEVQLLVTDVIMPGMNGRDLALALREKCPNLRMIYMSGYTQNIILQSGDSEEQAAYLQKPFTLEALARKVREVLDRPKAGHFTSAFPSNPTAKDAVAGTGLR